MGEGVFSSGNWGLVVPGSSSGFLTALVILMESCTVEGSLLQLVLLLWPKIDRVPLTPGTLKAYPLTPMDPESLLLDPLGP